MTNFIDFLSDKKIDYICNEPMKQHTTFKIGGEAEVFITVKNNSELKEVMAFVKKNNIPFFVLGKGSNLLVGDNGIKGAVISLGGDFAEIKVKGNNIYAGGGASLMRMCKVALMNDLSGLEFAYGIPGSVGGAVFMNAGAYGGEMKDCLISAEYVTPDGEIGTLSLEEMNLGYRTSVFKSNNYIITGCTVALDKAENSEIKDKMNDLLSRRREKQPIEYPSAGSTFKRPEGAFAGTLIESCGLKGYTVGGAQVSKKHAGFVINIGGATAEDVNALIKDVQDKVKTETGYFLETEVIRL